MNGFDLVVSGIIVFCLIRGLFKGLIGEISGIIAVIAGFYGAITYYGLLSPHLAGFIETPEIRHLVCFALLFCLICILVGLVAALIRKFLHLVFLGWVDRAFGMIFGAAKGILIATVLFIMLTAFLPGKSEYLKRSVTAPYLAQVSQALTLFVSRNLRIDFLKQVEGLKSNWKA